MKIFEEIIDKLQEHLETLFNEIDKSDYCPIGEIKNTDGIYVFYENGIPMYVGRTNNNRMRNRLIEHSARYSNKNSATFAFRIAKEMKGQPDLKNIDVYDPDFVKAKERISKMDIKTIEIHDPIIQTIFEPYIAFKLKTTEKHNTFKAH